MSIPKHVTQKLESQGNTIVRLTKQIARLDLERAQAQMDVENMIDDIQSIVSTKYIGQPGLEDHTVVIQHIMDQLRNIINKHRGNPIE